MESNAILERAGGIGQFELAPDGDIRIGARALERNEWRVADLIEK
jgi:hypothetical protein